MPKELSPQKIYSNKYMKGFTGKGRTIQSEAANCDINRMMKAIGQGGSMPPVPDGGYYGDFSNYVDYVDAHNNLKAADHAFAAMPADIRARFNHNPAELLEFLDDDTNREEAAELGLISKPEKEPAPTPDPPAPVGNPPE